jgi:hypothetical protein
MALTLSSPILPTYPILTLIKCSFNLTSQRIQKLKREFFFSWIGKFQIKKAFNNNTVQLNMLSDKDVALVNVNNLKAYQNPIISIVIIIIITKDINGIVLKELVEGRTFGRRWKQMGNLYECLNPTYVKEENDIIRITTTKYLWQYQKS